LEDRMRANIPVFHKSVKFPKVCTPFDVIPEAYKEWYISLFYKGERLLPPDISKAVITAPTSISIIHSTNTLSIQMYFESDNEIIDFCYYNGTKVINTSSDKYYINSKEFFHPFDKCTVTPIYKLIIGSKFSIKPNSDIGELKISIMKGGQAFYTETFEADNVMFYDNRVYLKQDDHISEIKLFEISTEKVLLASDIVGNVQKNASKIFDGVIIQDILGSVVASIFPESQMCYNISIPELKGYHISDAKYDKNMLIVIGNKRGRYDKFIIKISTTFDRYELRLVKDILSIDINFIVLDSGLVVHCSDNDEIEIFSNGLNQNKIRIVDKKDVSVDLKLFTDGKRVFGSDKNKLYQINMNG